MPTKRGSRRLDDSNILSANHIIRYILACESSHSLIRRDAIRNKVLGPDSRVFKKIINIAQSLLRLDLGLEISELPVKEKTTLRDKRLGNTGYLWPVNVKTDIFPSSKSRKTTTTWIRDICTVIVHPPSVSRRLSYSHS
jgi:hypothetical protein